MLFVHPLAGRRRLPNFRFDLLAALAVTLLAMSLFVFSARAQQPPGTTLPTVPITPPVESQTKQVAPPTKQPAAAAKARQPQAKSATPAPQTAGPPPAPVEVAPVAPPGSIQRQGSLTVPTTAEVRRELAGIAGTVVVVADQDFKGNSPATTVKDVLDFVPGVFAQPRWGEDSRLSIRGSGLARNFHLRGVTLLMDGMAINTADGHGDFQEIDPTAYRHVQVFRGATGLRHGVASLGGAIDFVTPTGRDSNITGISADIGSYGFHRLQSSIGGTQGAFDMFVTGSWQEQDGYRIHSAGEAVRLSGNVGIRISPDVETRFFFNANDIKQEIPGTVTRQVALTAPKTPAAVNVLNDWHRDVDSFRIGNKTTMRLAPNTVLEIGAFAVDRHLVHPIFLYFDYNYNDYGGFARLSHETMIGGFKDRLVFGLNAHNGTTDAQRFLNIGGEKGIPITRWHQESINTSGHIENHFYILPQLAVMAGTHFLHAVRDQKDLFGFGSEGRDEFNAWSPRGGLLWEMSKNAQAFLTISRSAEVPLFDDLYHPFTGAHLATRLQRATTVEIGTRGRTENFSWDIAAYHSRIRDELQCVFPFGIADFCIVENAERTIHQGLEFGVGAALWQGLFVGSDKLWLNTAYTFSDFRFDGHAQFGNNQLPGAPRHYLRSELLYKHPTGLFLGPNLEWVPEAYFVDSANTLKTAAYSLVGFKIGWEAEKGFAAYIEGRNLADVHYIASTGITNIADPVFTNLFEPGNGRAVFGGVKYKW